MRGAGEVNPANRPPEPLPANPWDLSPPHRSRADAAPHSHPNRLETHIPAIPCRLGYSSPAPSQAARRRAANTGWSFALHLILASGSQARQSLLRDAGVKCFAMPPDVDEAALKRDFRGTPEELALALASAKAAMIAACDKQALVIGADQLLVCEGQKFDKPVDLADAAQHLQHLRGRTHTLVTAVCVHQGDTCLWSNVAQARLTMRPLSDSFIAQYLEEEGAAGLGCVGAYRLEGRGAQLFSAVEGDFFTVLGLNLLPLLGYLRAAGVLPA
jgi:septum formation protein